MAGFFRALATAIFASGSVPAHPVHVILELALALPSSRRGRRFRFQRRLPWPSVRSRDSTRHFRRTIVRDQRWLPLSQRRCQCARPLPGHVRAELEGKGERYLNLKAAENVPANRVRVAREMPRSLLSPRKSRPCASEVAARRAGKDGTPHPRRAMRLARLFESVKASSSQEFLKAVVKHMARRAIASPPM